MCAWKYKQITSKVTVAKLQILEKKQLTELLDKKLTDILTVLEKTPYIAEISEINSTDLNSKTIEKALQKNYIKTIENLAKSAPKDIKNLLYSIMKKFEINNIKAMFRAKQSNLNTTHALVYIIPAGILDKEKCKKLFETSENISELVENLSEMQYGPLVEEAYTIYKEEKIFSLLEISLDKYAYAEIWNSVNKFRGLDKKIAKSIISLEIDIINIKTILRLKAMGIRDDKINRYLIPVSDIFGKKELQNIIKEKETLKIINFLVELSKKTIELDYYYTFFELQQHSITSLKNIEKSLNKSLIKASLRMIKRYTPYFNLAPILAFLYLKWFEVKNLKAIVRGSEAKISPEKIKNALVLLE